MRIQNLKAPHEAVSVHPASAPLAAAESAAAVPVVNTAATPAPAVAAPAVAPVTAGPVVERQAAEIALLKARVQHLELVVETARALMGANQERLLRRLHELPRELVELSAQLRRIDPTAAC